MYGTSIILGKFSRSTLDHLIRESSHIRDTGQRIDFLSRHFLGVGYSESTLTGDRDTPEVFVINLQGVDCMTFLEYMEAMRLSGSLSDFESNLKLVRYRSGIVDFLHRNHFFSDWREFNAGFIDDATERIGDKETMSIEKTLNEKDNGTYFLPGIPTVHREIRYIPSDALDGSVLGNLRTGDYIGIYSHSQGLDVSHSGIVIRDGITLHFRHASSQREYMKVIDQGLKEYLVDKPGIIVLRPKEPHRDSVNPDCA